MLSNSLVSIIIPVFNAENYLNECIESAIGQTWNNIEVIIVDDCSTDNSLHIATKYESKNVKVFRLNENKGQCAASNFGILKSKGDYIKFLDADDILNFEFIKNCLKNFDDDNTMYFAQCCSFRNEFNIAKVNPYVLSTKETMLPIDFLLGPEGNMRQGGRWLIPRKIIEQAGLWDESLSLINDYEYFTRLCLNSKKIKFVPDSILFYRIADNTLSGQRSINAFISAFRAIKIAHRYLIKTENSLRVKKYTADLLQTYLYTIFPEHRQLCIEIENEIKMLGGSKLNFSSSRKANFFASMFGWRFSLQLRYLFRKINIKYIMPR